MDSFVPNYCSALVAWNKTGENVTSPDKIQFCLHMEKINGYVLCYAEGFHVRVVGFF